MYDARPGGDVLRRRVLVTGGTGFIGLHLVRRCVARHDRVDVIVRASATPDRIALLPPGVQVHRIDLTDRRAVDQCLRQVGADEIYHLAVTTRRAQEPDLADGVGCIDDLVALTTLTTAAATCPRPPRVVVRAGTLAEYGAGPAPFVETQREHPLTPYAAALVAGTHWLAMIAPRLPFRAVTARMALVYGYGQSLGFLVPKLIENCLAGRPTILQRPDDRRDLIAVDDVVDALLRLAAASSLAPGLVNIATGIAPTMREVADLVAEATGAAAGSIVEAPVPAAGGVAHLCGSTRLAAEVLGWRAQTELRTGLERTVAAMRAGLVSKDLMPC